MIKINKAGVINDPLGQIHSHASSEHCFLLFCFATFEKWGQDGRTTCAKTMIPTGRDFLVGRVDQKQDFALTKENSFFA